MHCSTARISKYAQGYGGYAQPQAGGAYAPQAVPAPTDPQAQAAAAAAWQAQYGAQYAACPPIPFLSSMHVSSLLTTIGYEIDMAQQAQLQQQRQ